MITPEILTARCAALRGDNPWQQRARLLQSQWRERRGLAPGTHRDQPLGSRITIEDGRPPALANYLSPQAKKQVQTAVELSRTSGALLSRPRLWVDLLSSQPLCFNLFGPLAEDLDLATAALRLVWPHIHQVTAVEFEWSPGRGDLNYTGNRSAFDVFIAYLGPTGRSFLGIEVKYHEDLSGAPARDDNGRYPAIARRHGIFREDALPELQRLPLQQLWLDHLLALQMLASEHEGWQEGTFVLLSPTGNRPCTAAAQRYQRCLTDTSTFDTRRLEELIQALRMTTTDEWIDELNDRYFGVVQQF